MGVMVESYDAFVIHNEEGKDLEFVQEMARILEGPKYNLRLFLPWRDLQTTEDNETEVLAKIMVQRYVLTNILLFFISKLKMERPQLVLRFLQLMICFNLNVKFTCWGKGGIFEYKITLHKTVNIMLIQKL